MIKQAIQSVLAANGFHLSRLEPSAEEAVNQDTLARDRIHENFLNLADAYAYALNLPPNPRRATLLARQYGTPPPEALCILKALADTRTLAGDVCEFGCAQGETTALIANEILAGTKALHVFDSFEGLPKPTEKDRLKDDIFALGSMAAYEGTMSCPEAMVTARLDAVGFPWQRRVIHRGFIEHVLDERLHLPTAVSCAYVDFDFYEPIAQTLAYLHGVTPVGAIVIVDDYNFFSTGAKTAVDEFLAAQQDHYDCHIPATQYGYFAVLTKRTL